MKVCVDVSSFALHLGQRGEQWIPLFSSSLLRGRALYRILQINILCLGIVYKAQSFFQVDKLGSVVEGLLASFSNFVRLNTHF